MIDIIKFIFKLEYFFKLYDSSIKFIVNILRKFYIF